MSTTSSGTGLTTNLAKTKQILFDFANADAKEKRFNRLSPAEAYTTPYKMRGIIVTAALEGMTGLFYYYKKISLPGACILGAVGLLPLILGYRITKLTSAAQAQETLKQQLLKITAQLVNTTLAISDDCIEKLNKDTSIKDLTSAQTTLNIRIEQVFALRSQTFNTDKLTVFVSGSNPQEPVTGELKRAAAETIKTAQSALDRLKQDSKENPQFATGFESIVHTFIGASMFFLEGKIRHEFKEQFLKNQAYQGNAQYVEFREEGTDKKVDVHPLKEFVRLPVS